MKERRFVPRIGASIVLWDFGPAPEIPGWYRYLILRHVEGWCRLEETYRSEHRTKTSANRAFDKLCKES